MTIVLALLLSTAEPAPLACPEGTRRVERREGGRLRDQRCVDAAGVLDGVQVGYYDHGSATAVSHYQHGVRHGTTEYFYNDGTIWRRDEWRDGELQAKWLNPANANLTPERRTELGAASCGGVSVLVCGPGDQRPACKSPPPPPRQTFRLPDGRRLSGRYASGSRTGPWTVRYPDGRLAVRAEYSYGELAWSFQEWYPNGKPKAKGQYVSGEKVGRWRFWDAAGMRRQQDFSTKGR
jgi:hypothetical protein